MLPWAVISACTGDITLGVAILILWAIMSIVKAIYRAKNSKWANRNTSNIYFNCNVYRL